MKPKSYLTALNIQDNEIDKYLEEVDRFLHPYLIRIAEKAPKVYPLKEGIRLQIAGGKRRLRAAFCTTSCELFSGSYKEALHFAAAIEHLQNSLLIHDQITKCEDAQTLPSSILQRFGLAHSINIGDVFINLSVLAITDSTYSDELKIQLLELLCEQGFETAEGLNLDINLRLNNVPTIDEYIKCAKKKTGSFLAMAAKGGAIIGGARKDMVQLINNYAVLIGVAYEVGEELLDIRTSFDRPRGMYIKQGKRTLLSVYAAGIISDQEREKLFSILNNQYSATTDQDVAWVIQLYGKTGAIKYGEGFVRTIVMNALRYIDRIPDSEAKYKLLKISKHHSQSI